MTTYCDSAMAIIKGVIGRRGVIKVELDQSEPMYAAQSIQYGDFAKVEQLKNKYWYWGSFKRNFAYLWYVVFNVPKPSEDLALMYTKSCRGCSNCAKNEKPKSQLRWWHSFVSRPKKTSQACEIDYSQIKNQNCGHVIEKSVKSAEFLAMNDKNENFQEMRVVFGPEHLTITEFVNEGLKRGELQNENVWPSSEYIADSINASSFIAKFKESEKKKKLAVDGEWQEFSGEVRLSFLPRTLQYFYLPMQKS